MERALQVPWAKRMGHSHSAFEVCCSSTRMAIHEYDVRRIDGARQEQRQDINVAEGGPNTERGGQQVLGACLDAAFELATGGDELGWDS